MWWELWRLIRDVRPRFVVLENVSALIVRGLDVVLGALARLGYDAEWSVLSAAGVGAPHLRRRIFIVAWLPDAAGQRFGEGRTGGAATHGQGRDAPGAAHATRPPLTRRNTRLGALADSDGRRRKGQGCGK